MGKWRAQKKKWFKLMKIQNTRVCEAYWIYVLLLLHLMNNTPKYSIIDIYFNVAFIFFTSITVHGIFYKNSWSWLLFAELKRWGQVRKGYMCIRFLHRIFPLISPPFPQETRNHTRYPLWIAEKKFRYLK